jgi:hypothetical protein
LNGKRLVSEGVSPGTGFEVRLDVSFESKFIETEVVSGGGVRERVSTAVLGVESGVAGWRLVC